MLCENCEDADLEGMFQIFSSTSTERRWLPRDNDPGPTFDAIRRKSAPQVDWQWIRPSGTCVLCSILNQLKLLKELGSPCYRKPDEVCLIQARPGAPLVTLGSRQKPSGGLRSESGDWCFTNVEGKWREMLFSPYKPLQFYSTWAKGSFWTTYMIMDPIINCYEQIAALVESDISRQAEMAVRDMITITTIDTHSMRIVVKPVHERYIALSYVWGSGTDNEAFGVHLPKTIQDAITATKRLGYRYLWIDRYCIDQESEQRKQAQIRQMDRIYSDASLCLVAAAGDSPKHGLFGVSEPRPVLCKKPFCRIGNETLYFARKMQDMWNLVEKSKWASRGWTFQEFLFSKRLVFFTETGLILRTSKGWYPEWDFTKHGSSLNSMESVCWPPPLGDEHNFDDLLSEYTVRDMTFPADILNGFAGVLHRFTTFDEQMGCFCGILYHKARPSMFLEGILWTIETFGNENYVQIRGHHGSRLERRMCFPSWSWCGWYGKISYHLQLHIRFDANIDDIDLQQPEITVELEDGSRVSVPQAGEQSFNKPRLAETACLIVSTWFVELVSWDHHSLYDVTEGEGSSPPIDAEGRYYPSSLYSGILPWILERAKNGSPVECVGLVLRLNSSYVIPLMRKGSYWERCGAGYLHLTLSQPNWSTILREKATETGNQNKNAFRDRDGLKLEWGQFKVS